MGVLQVKTGTVTGTGSAINVECGFVPKRVEIINETDPGFYVWTDTMADGEMQKTIGAGTTTFESSGGISAYTGAVGSASKGFTIGTDADMNGSSDVIHYFALGTS